MDSTNATDIEAVENPPAAQATTDTEPKSNDQSQQVEDAAESVQFNDQNSVQPDNPFRRRSDEPAPIPERRCPTCKQSSPRPPKPDPTPPPAAPAHNHALTGANAAPLWIRAFYNQKIKSLKVDHAKTASVAQVRRELEALYAADPGVPLPRLRLEYLGDEDRMPLDSREHWHQALELVELRERAHLHVFCIDDPLRPPTPDEPPPAPEEPSAVVEAPHDVEEPTLKLQDRERALSTDGQPESTQSATPNVDHPPLELQSASPPLHSVSDEPPRLADDPAPDSNSIVTSDSPGPTTTTVGSDPNCDSSDSLDDDNPILLEPPDPVPPPPGPSRSSPPRSRTAPLRPPRDWDFSTNPRDLRDPEYEARLSLINPRDPLPPPPQTAPSAPTGSAPPRMRPRRASTSSSASSSTASSRSVSPARGSPVVVVPPPAPPAPMPLKSALKKRVSFSGDAAAKPFDRVPPLPQTRRINRISEEEGDDGDEVDGGVDDGGEEVRGRSMSFPPPPPPPDLPPVIGRSRSTSPEGLPRPPRSTPTTVMVPVLVPYVLIPAAALALQAPPMPLPPIAASGPGAGVGYLPAHSSEQIGVNAFAAREDLPPRPRSMVDYGGGGAGGAAGTRAAALPRRPHTTHAPPSYYRQYIEKQK
ncbi:hypothetical protein AMAG_19825 [Allomyces macrogynus ATCC 38327]|uniref:Uncharacterized protein n=1 Tax=Allomyces macrogynus (strain ATCC 38327) TaxID=578462 RepID=A0A0L0T088_ALLM3|nr:hypothetical protein AMAG_19825 [Allomyces macrogynus ATCC 38327]|eukprot:KNE67989.1 hypothetical protein AMAG_19825 [Allomyces macrogynus ATCC 38327]